MAFNQLNGCSSVKIRKIEKSVVKLSEKFKIEHATFKIESNKRSENG